MTDVAVENKDLMKGKFTLSDIKTAEGATRVFEIINNEVRAIQRFYHDSPAQIINSALSSPRAARSLSGLAQRDPDVSLENQLPTLGIVRAAIIDAAVLGLVNHNARTTSELWIMPLRR